MTLLEFNNLARAANLRESGALKAAKLVLVDGVGLGAAAREIGIDKGSFSRYMSKFPLNLCACCGQTVKTVDNRSA